MAAILWTQPEAKRNRETLVQESCERDSWEGYLFQAHANRKAIGIDRQVPVQQGSLPPGSQAGDRKPKALWQDQA